MNERRFPGDWLLLPAGWSGAVCRCLVAVERHLGEGTAFTAADLGDEQDLRPRSVGQARRAGSGNSAVYLELAGARGARATPSRSLVGVPLGFVLGTSKLLTRALDPIIQILRPVSPLAWLPLGLILFHKSQPAAVFTIAICSMWPTVLNTAVGVRAIPQDYLNVARVLRLSRWTMLWKILLPATLPYMFTGFRLSLGIAWLVIVAAEMLTGVPGVGGFLWQEYNSLIYEHIILCILTIGVVGFVLDRLMSVVEQRIKFA